MSGLVLVTGCSSGIGLRIAIELIDRGFEVIGIARSRPSIVSEKFTFVEASLSPESGLKVALEAIGNLPKVQKCQVVVHCARALTIGSAFSISHRSFLSSLYLHVLSVAEINRSLSADMIANKGKIIHVGSISAAHAALFISAYAASKAALRRYSESLRREVKSLGVDVCYVDLGNVAAKFGPKANIVGSEMVGKNHHSPTFARFLALVEKASKKSVSPEIIGKKICALVSAERLPAVVRLGSDLPRSLLFRSLPPSILDRVYEIVLRGAGPRQR